MPVRFEVNRAPVEVPREWEGDTLLWVLREHLGLVGTKYGCGVGTCGACTVHVDGAPRRACLLPCASLEGARVTTIEGLSDGRRLHPVQQAWLEARVAQCGYCQSGQIMSVAALLVAHPAPSPEAIEAALAGNLCRCGTYGRIREAVRLAASLSQGSQ